MPGAVRVFRGPPGNLARFGPNFERGVGRRPTGVPHGTCMHRYYNTSIGAAGQGHSQGHSQGRTSRGLGGIKGKVCHTPTGV